MKLILLFLILFPVTQKAYAEPSTVTIPLSDYLNLIEKNEPEKTFTSVSEIQVQGSFGKPLSLDLKGTASSSPEEVKIMPFSSDFRVSNCRGSGTLSVKEGHFFILPNKKSFQTHCEINVTHWERPLNFEFLNTVSAQVEIKGAEASMSPGLSGYRYNVMAKNREPAGIEGATPTLKSFYKLTLTKDRNTFIYRFHINNPNSSVVEYDLENVNGEKIQRVLTRSKYAKTEKGIKLTLKPGNTTVALHGSLEKNLWNPPSQGQLSYVLIDQHPLISTEVTTEARNVSPSETNMHNNFPAPKAYLLSKGENLKWEKSELDSFVANTYSIDYAKYKYFWSPKGTSLVEARFDIQNQSATEVALTIPGTPTYLAINSQALNLSKNKNDQLLVKLRPNQSQEVFVQYQVAKDPARGIAGISENLVRPDTTISNYLVDLTLPQTHQPLMYKTGNQSFWPMTLAHFLKAFVVFLMFLKLSHFLNSKTLWNRSLGLTTAFLTFLWPPLFSISLIAGACASIFYQRKTFFRRPKLWDLKDYGKMLALGLLLILMNSALNRIKGYPIVSSANHTAGSLSQDSSYGALGGGVPYSNPKSAQTKGFKVKRKQINGSLASAGIDNLSDYSTEEESFEASPYKENQSDAYKGLPVPIRMPSGGQSYILRETFSNPKESLSFYALTISGRFLYWTKILLLILVLFSLYKIKDELFSFLLGKPKEIIS